MSRLSGVIAATPTPLNSDLSIDEPRLVSHCKWLLEEGGCNGVNLLGTTGEAMSFSVEQRVQVMRAVADLGVPLHRMMVGTGAAALEDTVRLTATARDLGFAGALVVPPFFYKGITPDALLAYFDALITRAGSTGLRLYLYHIPQNTGVPFPIGVVTRIHEKHAGVVLGLKDSAGDLAYSRELASALPGFDVFPGSEGSLLEARTSGFAGCISATTNVTGPLARRAWEQPQSEQGRLAGSEALAIRSVLARYPLVASVKLALSVLRDDRQWERVCPPLFALGEAERAVITAEVLRA